MKVANHLFARCSSRRLAAIAVGTAAAMSTTLSAAAPRPSLLLYWSDHGNPGPSLWAMRPDGSHQHLIYHAYANAKRPTLSPEGTWIAFDGASPGKKPFSDFDVQIVRTNGKARSTVAGNERIRD